MGDSILKFTLGKRAGVISFSETVSKTHWTQMHYPCTAECNHAPKQEWNALRAASVRACLLSTRTCNYQQWRVWIRRIIQPFFNIAFFNRCLNVLFNEQFHFELLSRPRQHWPFKLVLTEETSNAARSAESPQERDPIRVKATAGQMRTKMWMKGVNPTDDSTIFEHCLLEPLSPMFCSTSQQNICLQVFTEAARPFLSFYSIFYSEACSL